MKIEDNIEYLLGQLEQEVLDLKESNLIKELIIIELKEQLTLVTNNN